MSEKSVFTEPLELGHHEIVQRVEFDRVMPLGDTGPLVRLYASVEAHTAQPPGPGKHQGATTLAIRMDPKAAIALAQQIYATGRTMGWSLPTLIGTQA